MEARITYAARNVESETRPRQPRARGAVSLSVKQVGGHSRIDRLRQSGSLKCLFPRQNSRSLEAVLINTAGGITGGDDFLVEARAGPGTTLSLTTQTAERAYRSLPGERGGLATRIEVAEGARVNWLPQETILFNGSAFQRSLTIDLAPGATALYCESLIFGRLAMGESITSALFHDRTEIRRSGAPLYLDALRLSGDIAAQMDRPHTAAGARAMATVVLISPKAERHLRPLRRLLPPTGGASLLGEDVIALRLLACDSHLLRQSLIPVLTLLLQEDLPRCWMI